jgi:hypothetical protein
VEALTTTPHDTMLQHKKKRKGKKKQGIEHNKETGLHNLNTA